MAAMGNPKLSESTLLQPLPRRASDQKVARGCLEERRGQLTGQERWSGLRPEM